jgi:hypothetical protein
MGDLQYIPASCSFCKLPTFHRPDGNTLVARIAGDAMPDLGPMEHSPRTRAAVNRNNLRVRLVIRAVFRAPAAFSGCLLGIRCGRSASAVGEATTSAGLDRSARGYWKKGWKAGSCCRVWSPGERGSAGDFTPSSRSAGWGRSRNGNLSPPLPPPGRRGLT